MVLFSDVGGDGGKPNASGYYHGHGYETGIIGLTGCDFCASLWMRNATVERWRWRLLRSFLLISAIMALEVDLVERHLTGGSECNFSLSPWGVSSRDEAG